MELENNLQRWVNAATEGLTVRSSESLSWYDFETNKRLIMMILQKMDQTKKIIWLPEYDEIADWMVDTKGKGLNLIGDCGRGKSNILKFVVPAIFREKGKVISPVHSQYLKNTVDIYNDVKLYERICKNKYGVAVDEVGEESVLNDYGTQIDMMNFIVNNCEDGNKYLFITTNLGEDDLVKRYDLRFVSRIRRLCRTVPFIGEDYRTK